MSGAIATRNVTRVFRTATESELSAGLNWYSDARESAASMARAFDVDMHTAAGVIAAVSPRNSWGNNVRLATRILESGGTLDRGYLSNGLRTANAIVAGRPPLELLTSLKVRNFYLSIVTSGRKGVCIDRHAYDVATHTRHTDETRPGITPKRYGDAVSAYERAARILSGELEMPLSAADVQATTWVTWRRRFWSAEAFN